MIELLPKWHLHNNRPSFYDTDSVTMLELAAKMHGAMNELITDYNAFVDRVNERVEQHIKDTESDQEVFETALRQEFQDFIDVINIKYDAQEQIIRNLIAQCEQFVNNAIAQMEAAKNEFVEDIHGAIDELLSAEY